MLLKHEVDAATFLLKTLRRSHHNQNKSQSQHNTPIFLLLSHLVLSMLLVVVSNTPGRSLGSCTLAPRLPLHLISETLPDHLLQSVHLHPQFSLSLLLCSIFLPSCTPTITPLGYVAHLPP